MKSFQKKEQLKFIYTEMLEISQSTFLQAVGTQSA